MGNVVKWSYERINWKDWSNIWNKEIFEDIIQTKEKIFRKIPQLDNIDDDDDDNELDESFGRASVT